MGFQNNWTKWAHHQICYPVKLSSDLALDFTRMILTYIVIQLSREEMLMKLRIGDIGSTIIFKFISLTKNLEYIFFHKNIQILCVKSVKESKYLIRISICLVVLDLWPKICQNESFSHFPCQKNKNKNKNLKMRKNESHHDNPWNLLYISVNFHMSGIFSSLNI